MSIPKFTAEASIGNYGIYEHINGWKHKNDDGVKIEPAKKPRMNQSCAKSNCETRVVRYPCGSRGEGQPPEMCEREETMCDCECYYYDADGNAYGPIYVKCPGHLT